VLHSSLDAAADRVEKQQAELKAARKEVDELKRKMALGGGGRDLLSNVREVAGIKVLSSRADVGDPKALREVADQLRDKIKSGVVVLGGVSDGKVALVAAVTPDLVGRVQAGKIIAQIAAIVGGKGGGRPDLAQAGGSDAGKLDEALQAVYGLIS
jgi:alanyl-tRNA synthetase